MIPSQFFLSNQPDCFLLCQVDSHLLLSACGLFTIIIDVLKILTASRDGAKDLVASAQEYASPRERQDKRVFQGMMIRASAGRSQVLPSFHGSKRRTGELTAVSVCGRSSGSYWEDTE